MKKRIIYIFAASLAIGTILSGCGSEVSSESFDSNYYKTDNYSMAEEAALADYDYSYEDDYSGEANGEIYETKLATESAEELSTEEIEALSNRKLIKTVNLSVETREFDELISNISAKITQLGGYAESTNINGNSYDYDDYYSKRSAYIVARIPAKNLDSFVTSVENASNITSKTESAEDVTLRYSDVKAHIDSLKVEQTRLNELLAEADSLETIIALEQRMTEVRYELESYESSLRLMDNQVDYSTVNIDINEVKEYKPEPIEDPTFAERLSEKFTDNCAAAFVAIQDFIIGFISFLPILLVIIIILGVVGGVIYLIVRIIIAIVKKSSAKSKVKKEKKIAHAQVVENRPEIAGGTENSKEL